MIAPRTTNENFFTLPPPTRFHFSAERCSEGRVFRAPAPFSSATKSGRNAAVYDGWAPKWRNWQTRRTQNPVPSGECGFDSHLRHSRTGHSAGGRSVWSVARYGWSLGRRRTNERDRFRCHMPPADRLAPRVGLGVAATRALHASFNGRRASGRDRGYRRAVEFDLEPRRAKLDGLPTQIVQAGHELAMRSHKLLGFRRRFIRAPPERRRFSHHHRSRCAGLRGHELRTDVAAPPGDRATLLERDLRLAAHRRVAECFERRTFFVVRSSRAVRRGKAGKGCDLNLGGRAENWSRRWDVQVVSMRTRAVRRSKANVGRNLAIRGRKENGSRYWRLRVEPSRKCVCRRCKTGVRSNRTAAD